MKRLLCTMAVSLFYLLLPAQDYNYFYDAAGNRIEKYPPLAVELPGTLLPMSTEVQTNTVFIDSLSNNLNWNAAFGADSTSQSPVPPVIHSLVYPNPTAGYFSLELHGLPENETGDIHILNKMGKPVFYQHHVLPAQSIDISGVPPDVYLIRIKLSCQPAPIVIAIIKY